MTIRDARLRDMIAARSARPALLGAVLITARRHRPGTGSCPPRPRRRCSSAAALNILVALIFALTIVVFFLLYFGPYRNPGWLSPGFAGSLCLFGIAAFSTGEFIREAVRKPFVVYNVVLGNQVLPDEVPKHARRPAICRAACGPSAYVANSTIRKRSSMAASIAAKLLKLSHEDRVALGEVLFQHHCNDCHADDRRLFGRWGVAAGAAARVGSRDVEHLEGVYFMPPWCGTAEEAELMTDYLMSINPPRPARAWTWALKSAGR